MAPKKGAAKKKTAKNAGSNTKRSSNRTKAATGGKKKSASADKKRKDEATVPIATGDAGNNAPPMIAGQVCWNELNTTDPENAIAFYQGLFGWKTESTPMPGLGEYVMARARNSKVDLAGITRSMPGVPSHWMTYFLVADLETAEQRALSLGATLLMETTEIPIGSFCILKDPTGAAFALFESSDA
ncbi:MAG: VOC family protein [Leptospiraceae bacterium]|nr:VOC family protein [Leptospiraceae bacterium]